jgi:hypothetical protein
MFVSVPASPSFPPADALLSFLRNVDWKRRFIQLVLLAATVAAFTVAVSTFAAKHAKRFWSEHGEEITLRFELFVERLEEAIRLVHQAGVISRPVAVRWLNRLADWLFYQLAA